MMKPEIARLHYITRDCGQFTHSRQAEMMYRAGVKCVQVRMKGYPVNIIAGECEQALKYAREYNGALIIDDHVEVARNIGVHGVHLGLKDMPVDHARKILGKQVLIGATANTLDEVLLQASLGADYLGVGPFRFTTTKQNLGPVIGLEGFKKLINKLEKLQIKIPVIAVGGITINDIPGLRHAGVHGVAISSALFDMVRDSIPLLNPFTGKLKDYI